MKNIVTVVATLVLLTLIILVFWKQGRQFGADIIQNESEWTDTDYADQKPQIYAICRRVKQGDRIALSGLAGASDADGSDLSGKLCCYDEKGQLLTGFLDTDKPGIKTLSWEVASICTGRRIRKKIIILVDGRIESERDSK